MTLTTLAFRPGIFSDVSDYTAEGSWVDCNLIRWRDGIPENMRSWEKFTEGKIAGVPRAAHSWAENDGTRVFAVGTTSKVYIFRGGAFHNITPIESSGVLGANPFTTAMGSNIVTVSHPGHNRTVGSLASFSGSTGAVNGVTVDGDFDVLEVVNAGEYTFSADEMATGSSSGGGPTVAFSYEIATGNKSAVFGRGWSAGPWGKGTWGDAREASSLKLALRTWYFDNWGEDLLIMPSDGGSLYHWDATTGPQTRAQIVTNAPTNNLGMIVSPEDRHVILLGAGGDPLAVQSCDQGDFTNWVIDATTDAIHRRLLHGSMIVTGYRAKGEIVIWTNGLAAYALQYVGGQFTFNLRRLADKASVIGKKSVIEYNGVLYWMGAGAFYRYDGRIRIIPCSVQKAVFGGGGDGGVDPGDKVVDRVQGDKVTAALIEESSEIIWFYTSKAGTGENDRYVKHNTLTGEWDYGSLDRTAWIGAGIFDRPLGFSPDGGVYSHEVGSPEQEVSITIKTRTYPGDEQTVNGPWAVTPTTRQLWRRARGRVASIRIDGAFQADGEDHAWFIESGDSDLGDGEEVMFIRRVIPDFKWGETIRLGRIRVDPQVDGQR